LHLHDWNADFAVWCSYKFLNAGPGAVGGCFVHEKYAGDPQLPRFAGWWGHDKSARFMFEQEFKPIPGAEGWQVSNLPILSTAPLLASLEIFHRAGLAALQRKSATLTAFLRDLIQRQLGQDVEVITPSVPGAFGCQLSLRIARSAPDARRCQQQLTAAGVIGDWREPDILRFAPIPLYNSYSDVFAAVAALEKAVRG
jgi:kynureninase